MIRKNYFRGVVTLLLPFILLLNSCASREKIVYLQDIESNLTKENLNYEPVIQNDDLLSITVTSVDMTSVAAYNQNTFLQQDGGVMLNPQPNVPGYLVDGNGEIMFLELGKIKVAGKTRLEVIDLMKAKLERFIVNPLIDVRILNFKVTVLGEVNKPGTYDIVGGNRVSIPQALGLAGDLTIFGDRKSILLVRDDNGTQTTKRIDLTNAGFINDETYFLKQNDLIIVSPNDVRIQNANFNQNAQLYVSVASLLLTAVVIIVNTN